MASKGDSRSGILQGTLDLMVLQTLAALGPRHGYALGARIEQVSGGTIDVNMGTLYPALMRLEQRRLIHGEWGTTDTNRRARFYSITANGRRSLKTERADWNRMVEIIAALAHEPEPPK